MEQTYRFAECKRSKIGTFLNAGWRCGGGYLRGRDWLVAPLRSASFGAFLAETRKARNCDQFDKLKFEFRSIESGGNVGYGGMLLSRGVSGGAPRSE